MYLYQYYYRVSHKKHITVAVIFVGSAAAFRLLDQIIAYDSKMMLTVSTFLFSIFAGFFISRQGIRFNAIRTCIVQFDAAISTLYRFSRHIGAEAQQKIGDIIINNYGEVIGEHDWDITFSQDTTIIKDINMVYEDQAKSLETETGKAALSRSFMALEKMQEARKNILSLKLERIPVLQWILIYALAGILLSTVTLLPMQSITITPLLKASFATVVVAVLIMLHDFDNLNFFERSIGEESAKDVIDIIKRDRKKI